MVVQKDARNIQFFDLVVSRRAVHAPYPALEKLVELWQEAANDTNYKPKTFNGDQVTSLITDMKIDTLSKTVTILIDVADQAAPDHSYGNHVARKARHLKKENGEGNGHAAHMVISLVSETGKPNSYLAVLEAMPTISPYRVRSTLNDILRTLCSVSVSGRFTYEKPGGVKKPVSFVPHIDLAGHPSDQFKRDIENGNINGLQLIAPATQRTLGQDQFLKVDESLLRVKVSRDIPVGQRLATILRDIKGESDNFPKTRIHIQPERDGKSFHIDLDTETGNVISQAYVKSSRISAIDPLLEKAAPEAIVPHFEKLMKAKLIGARQ